jgi:hypothetical protein
MAVHFTFPKNLSQSNLMALTVPRMFLWEKCKMYQKNSIINMDFMDDMRFAAKLSNSSFNFSNKSYA